MPAKIVAEVDQAVLLPGERIWVCNALHIQHSADTLAILDTDGNLQLPYLGKVTLAGLTPNEAEAKIVALYLATDLYRNVNVTVERVQDSERLGQQGLPNTTDGH